MHQKQPPANVAVSSPETLAVGVGFFGLSSCESARVQDAPIAIRIASERVGTVITIVRKLLIRPHLI